MTTSDSSESLSESHEQITPSRPQTAHGKRKSDAPEIAARKTMKLLVPEGDIESRSKELARHYLKVEGFHPPDSGHQELTSLMRSVLRKEYSQAYRKAKTLSRFLPESELKQIRRACDYLDNPHITPDAFLSAIGLGGKAAISEKLYPAIFDLLHQHTFSRDGLIQAIAIVESIKKQYGGDKRLTYLQRDLLTVFCQGRGIRPHNAYFSALGVIHLVPPVHEALFVIKELLASVPYEHKPKVLETFANYYGIVPSERFYKLTESMNAVPPPDFFQVITKLEALKKEKAWPVGCLNAFSLAIARANILALQSDKMESDSRRERRKDAIKRHLSEVMERSALGVAKATLYNMIGDSFQAMRSLSKTRKNVDSKSLRPFGIHSLQDLDQLEQTFRDQSGPSHLDIQIDSDPALEELREIEFRLQESLEKIAQSQKEKAGLARELTREKLISTTLKKQRDRQTASAETLTKKIEDLEGSLEQVSSQRNAMAADVKSLHDKARDLHEQLQAVMNNYAALLFRRDLQDQVVQHLQSQNRHLKEELRAHRGEFYEASSDIKDAGRGLKARYDIRSGASIGDYSGDRVYRLWVPKLGKYAAWKNDEHGRAVPLTDDTYALWVVDEDPATKQPLRHGKRPDIGVLATDSIFRFMNHSSDPNVSVQIVASDDGQSSKPVLFTCKAVKKGDEVTWDYDPSKQVNFKDGEKDMITDLVEFRRYMTHSPDKRSFVLRKPRH